MRGHVRVEGLEMEKPTYRIVLSCHGVPAAVGPQAAEEINGEFAEHRDWHRNTRCTWDGTRLVLEAENDYDPQGQALLDEFSDCVCAFTPVDFSFRVEVDSVEEVAGRGGTA